MSSLRRDLVERKLWMVVAALVVAVVAIPVFLLKGASASTTPTVPAPPAATGTTAQSSTTATTPSAEPVKVVLAKIARDPFASQVPKLSSKPSSPGSAGRSSSATPSTSTTSPTTSPSASSSPSAPVSMVSPSPATTTSSPSTSSAPSTAASNTPTSTIASVSPSTQRERPAPESWTTYSVSVRYGKDQTVPVRSDIARLTPLPSIVAPQAMFMGVMADGGSAVFALHAGLGHTGPGLCRLDHTRCSAIVLQAGQTEHLSIPMANGGHRQVGLRVVKISRSVTHSRSVALAAFDRVNAAGQCELDLANPVSYDPVTGTIASVAKAACQKHPNAVPFASLVMAP